MKVVKAIRGLAPVSSVVWESRTESHADRLFVAAGRHVGPFQPCDVTTLKPYTSQDPRVFHLHGQDDPDLVRCPHRIDGRC